MGGMGGRARGPQPQEPGRDREGAEGGGRTEAEGNAGLARRRDEEPDAKAEEEGEGSRPANQQFKEITKGLRWVAITGVLDHAKLVANYREALKTAAAAPHYARLDLERQDLQKDGTWSEWETVDADENYKILDNLPEEDEELTPENVRPDNLNDPLPFLKAGLWEKVHIASLVPKEKKESQAASRAWAAWERRQNGDDGRHGRGMGGGSASMIEVHDAEHDGQPDELWHGHGRHDEQRRWRRQDGDDGCEWVADAGLATSATTGSLRRSGS